MIVVNPKVRSGELSHTALRSVFSMRLRHWPDGSPLHVFVLPDKNPIHSAVSKRILGVFPHQLRWAWDRLVFSGTGQAPETVQTEEEMRARLASTPGAIGYLSRSMVDDSVRVLRIEDDNAHN
jgi:ABC-type phosphate transport system substrate-binding protein